MKRHSNSVWGRMLGYPEAWLALSQVASLGVTMTLYGLIFLLASTPTHPGPSTTDVSKVAKDGEDSPLTPTGEISGIDAQAVAVATVVGAAAPSLALFAYRDPSITVLWQAFPLYIFLARIGYRRFISKPSPVRNTENTAVGQADGGYKSVRALLLSSFALSAYFHISFIWTLVMRADISSLFKSFSEVQGVDALPLNVLVFLMWDFVFSALSTLLALGFDAVAAGKKIGESKLAIVRCIVGCLVVGPGAVVAICVLRREDRLGSGLIVGDVRRCVCLLFSLPFGPIVLTRPHRSGKHGNRKIQR